MSCKEVLTFWLDMGVPISLLSRCIGDYIEKVVVHRARPGLQRFDSTRVKIKWRKPLRP